MEISGSIRRTDWKFGRSVASRKSPSPFTFQNGAALPGFGCMRLRTRFFPFQSAANGVPYGSQSSSVQSILLRIPALGGSLLSGTGYPSPLFFLQNLENKRFILSLCARSLSLKELEAKS
jgi:hypothetical protein